MTDTARSRSQRRGGPGAKLKSYASTPILPHVYLDEFGVGESIPAAPIKASHGRAKLTIKDEAETSMPHLSPMLNPETTSHSCAPRMRPPIGLAEFKEMLEENEDDTPQPIMDWADIERALKVRYEAQVDV